jgi:hypothetical protein
MIWIVKTSARSGNALALKNNCGGFMNLPLIAHRLTGLAAGRPAIQAGLIAAAALAGYFTLIPFQHKSTASVASADQPQWVGHIEGPDTGAPAPLAPITSASYVVPEATLTGNAAKKSTSAAAPAPKAVSKLVLPPHRPADEASHAVPAPAVIMPAAVTPATSVPPELIPPEMIPAGNEVKTKPQPRNLLSRVADRLPEKGSLLKPFNVVGDAFHSLIKSF